jgi:hypothetical protein
MIIASNNCVEEHIRSIIIPGSFTAVIDGAAREVQNLTVTSQTITGFMALTDLEPLFRHMKCWNDDGSDCPTCPVRISGQAVCAVSSIKAACFSQASQ